MKKYLNRKWVLVTLAIIATVVLGWYLLNKTAAGKKMAAKVAGAGNPAPATVPATTTTTTTTTPAATLAGNLRYN